MISTEQDPSVPGPPEQAPIAPTSVEAAVARPVVSAVAPSATAEDATPWVIRLWRRMLHEPSLLVTLAYLFVSFIGLWSSYWFYRGFNLPILEYMQASDYLVAGLRDPAYAILLLSSLLLVLMISWPETYRRRYPERVEAYRRRWWGRAVFSNVRGWGWTGIGLAPETGIVFAVFWGMVWASAAYVADKGESIRNGESGNRVSVTLAGDATALPQTARLLGSSSAFVFLWWPQQRLAEAVPIESIGRLQSVAPPRSPAKATSAPSTPGRVGSR